MATHNCHIHQLLHQYDWRRDGTKDSCIIIFLFYSLYSLYDSIIQTNQPHSPLFVADYSTSEMLVNMGNLPLDEFYPAVAIVTLMRILRDPSLSNHHTMVVQAVTFIFKSLGLKCVQFLPQVMPTFLNVIRVCDASIREVSCCVD